MKVVEEKKMREWEGRREGERERFRKITKYYSLISGGQCFEDKC